MVVCARLYGNLSALSLGGVNFSKLAAVQPGVRDRISYNVAQSCVDTWLAQISKNKPKPYFLTSGGDYKERRKAKKLNQFTEGLLYENKWQDLRLFCLRDGATLGDGVVHLYKHGEKKKRRVCMERVLASELYADEVEGFYGKPRRLHRVKDVDRKVLEALYPGCAEAIASAKAATHNDKGESGYTADMVTLRESWHLRSGPSAKDGKHVITVDGACLFSEDWNHDFFPFARFQWSPRLWGYWSQSGVEQIQNLQLEINKLLWVLQRSYHLAGSFKVFLENGSKVVKEHLNNDIGAIVNYTGTKPEYVTPPVVPAEMYSHLETLIKRAYDQFGISMLNATSTKPAGLNSGKALREYSDINSDRFTVTGLRDQQFVLDAARIGIALARDIYEEDGAYSVTVPGTKFLRTVDWKDIDLEESDYVMQCFPISSLPNDPAGRLQTVQEYAQAGYITPRQAKKLLDFPDLEQLDSLQGAEEEWLSEVFDKMVDEGEFIAPEPYDDLQLAREMAQEYYAQGKCHGLEEDRLELLRRYMLQLDGLEAAASAAMAPPPVPGATNSTAPGAVPAAPPVSDLLPNAPGAGAVQ